MENRIGGVFCSHFVNSCMVDRVFELLSDQNKDYDIGICYFSIEHTALKNQSKDYLGRNKDNVSECRDMSTCELLFQKASTVPIQLRVLVHYKANTGIMMMIISSNVTCSRHDIADKLLISR